MAHLTSDAAVFKLDNNAGTLTDISGSVNSVTFTGGNSSVDDTGLGDARHTEITDILPIQTVTVNGMLNTTTEAIIMPMVDGFSTAKTVEILTVSGKYISGEARVGSVEYSVPIGLQTWSLELRSADVTGLAQTSVAL